MEPRFCIKCGNERVSGAQFCSTCGSPFAFPQELSRPDPSPIEVAPDVQAAYNGRVKSPTHGSVSPSWLIAAGLAILAMGTFIWGTTTNQSLEKSGSDLVSTKAALAVSASQLTTSNGDLVSAKTRIDANAVEADRLQSLVAGLTDQVSRQTNCIAALTENAAELARISELQRANYNRFTSGSKWQKANTAALDDYYNAYSAAFSGRYSTANSWIAKGNAQIKLANAQIKTGDAATTTIEKAQDALLIAITASSVTCGS